MYLLTETPQWFKVHNLEDDLVFSPLSSSFLVALVYPWLPFFFLISLNSSKLDSSVNRDSNLYPQSTNPVDKPHPQIDSHCEANANRESLPTDRSLYRGV